jgi:hypothetical protein
MKFLYLLKRAQTESNDREEHFGYLLAARRVSLTHFYGISRDVYVEITSKRKNYTRALHLVGRMTYSHSMCIFAKIALKEVKRIYKEVYVLYILPIALECKYHKISFN